MRRLQKHNAIYRSNALSNFFVFQYSESPDARAPTEKWRLYVFKDGEDTCRRKEGCLFMKGESDDVFDICLYLSY